MYVCALKKIYEKIIFCYSAAVVLAGLCLAYENYILATQGPRMRTTGYGIAHYCSGGLTDLIAQICNQLSTDNMTAVFSFNRETDPKALASFVGRIDANGSVPGTALQTVDSLFNPVGWINYFTCQQNGGMFRLEGHSFQGSRAEVAESVINNRFLVYASESITFFTNMKMEIGLFLASFCLLVKDGGFSLYQNAKGQINGPFDGYQEVFTKDFKTYGYAYGISYGILVGFAALSLSVILWQKKLMSDETAELAKNAYRLYGQHAGTSVAPRSGSEMMLT